MASRAFTGRTVLVSDDDPAFVEALRFLLESGGFEVVGAASNGADAVNLAAKTQPRFALIDFDMPRMDGVTATRLIRRWWPNVTVIVISGIDDPEVEKRAKRAGAAAFVSKAEIAESLLKLLETQAQPTAESQ